MTTRRQFLVGALSTIPACWLPATSSLAREKDQNWPGFRGLGGRGVADGYPTRAEWNLDPASGTNGGLLWRTGVPGLGHSSPIIWKDRIYLATAVPRSGQPSLRVGYYGDVGPANDDGEQDWLVQCLDKRDGRLKWERLVRTAKPSTVRHEKASHANTTLVTDGRRLVGFFGSDGLYCLDMKGRVLWQRELGRINVAWKKIPWGYASSPALSGDRIVLLCDDENDPFIAALSLRDGREIWRVSRRDRCENSWGSPLIHDDRRRRQVVANGYPYIVSYDLETGAELWRLRGGGDIPIPTPFVAEDHFVISNAHGGKAPLFAVRMTASGDISLGEGLTSNESVAWSVPNGGSYISTPVVYDGLIYLANHNGVMRCFDFKTGKRLYEERLGPDSSCSASLVAADGKIYCATEQGLVHTIKAGPTFERLARNDLGEPCLATPAISRGVIYFRTSASLLAIK